MQYLLPHTNSGFTSRQPTEVNCSTVLAHEGVYFNCPLCPVTVLQSEIDAHLSECLYKVCKIAATVLK